MQKMKKEKNIYQNQTKINDIDIKDTKVIVANIITNRKNKEKNSF